MNESAGAAYLTSPRAPTERGDKCFHPAVAEVPSQRAHARHGCTAIDPDRFILLLSEQRS